MDNIIYYIMDNNISNFIRSELKSPPPQPPSPRSLRRLGNTQRLVTTYWEGYYCSDCVNFLLIIRYLATYATYLYSGALV